MLPFPAEPSEARSTPGFEYGNIEGGTTHSLWLTVANSQQRAVGDALDEPLPKVLVEMRNVRMSSSKATRSTISGCVARDWISEPPNDSKNSPFSVRPVRCSAIWLAPPVTTF
jgi:hypothetical protein